MRRRTLLATLAALGGAGCSEVVPEPQPTATTDGRPTTDGPTDKPPSETEPPTTGETPSETTGTDADTPSTAERRATETLAAARDHLAEAHAAFVGVAEATDPTLADVSVGTQLAPSTVSNPVNRAGETLNGLPDGANETQRATAAALRAVGEFLLSGARCQAALAGAVSEFRFVVDRIYAGNTGSVPANVRELREFQRQAGDALAAVESDTDPTDAAAFEPVGEAGYTAKLDQLRAAVDAAEPLPGALTALRRGVDAFRRGADAYAGDSYGTAVEEFGVTVETTGSANGTLSTLEAPEAIATTVSELVADTASLSAAAADFREAAEPASRGLRPSSDAVKAGKEHLRAASDRVREFQATTRLLRQ